MSIPRRFAKLLQRSVDPETFTQLSVAAQAKVRTLDDCLMEVALARLPADAFAALKREAEAQEAQSASDRGRTDADLKAPPVKPDGPPPTVEIKLPHAQARMAERYGVQVTEGDLAEMAQIIKAREPGVKLVRNMMAVRSTYEIVWRGKRMLVVYVPKDSKIITAIPFAPAPRKVAVGKPGRGNPRSHRVEVDEDGDVMREERGAAPGFEMDY